MKSLLSLVAVGGLALGSFGLSRSSAEPSSCCDHENARGCSPTGTCTACTNCKNCKHCKSGGTCSVCKKKDEAKKSD